MSTDKDLETGCAGTGWVNCYCGGDQCYCHRNGGTDCPGCPDCEERFDYDEDDSDDFNPDACPVCGEDIAGLPICMECGHIPGQDDDDD